MEHTKHIIRAVGLLVIAVVLFVLVRHFAIPKSFGEYGHYRADSLDDYRDLEPRYGSANACAECHDEEAEAKAEGKHASVGCESCHGPLFAEGNEHVQNDEHANAMPVYRDIDLCLVCHQRLISRPKTFPQIVIPDHVVEKGAEMDEAVCLECHNAHNPSESE